MAIDRNNVPPANLLRRKTETADMSRRDALDSSRNGRTVRWLAVCRAEGQKKLSNEDGSSPKGRPVNPSDGLSSLLEHTHGLFPSKCRHRVIEQAGLCFSLKRQRSLAKSNLACGIQQLSLF